MSPSARVDALLFDLDGVLVDSRPAWYAALIEIQREFAVPITDRATFDRRFGQSAEADARDFFAGVVSVDELTARYDAVFPRHVHTVRPMESNATATLASFRRGGRSLAIVTNAPGRTADAMLAHTELAHAFDLIVTPESGAPKPAPDLLLHACRSLGVATVAALFLGDSDTDVAAGLAAGVEVIGYGRRGTRGRIDTLAELSRYLR